MIKFLMTYNSISPNNKMKQIKTSYHKKTFMITIKMMINLTIMNHSKKNYKYIMIKLLMLNKMNKIFEIIINLSLTIMKNNKVNLKQIMIKLLIINKMNRMMNNNKPIKKGLKKKFKIVNNLIQTTMKNN